MVIMWSLPITRSSEGRQLFVRPIRTRHRAAAILAAGVSGLLLAGAVSAPADPSAAATSVQALRVNTFANPIGIGDATPELSWRLTRSHQTAYEVRVASSEAQLEHPGLWDSGKVGSSENHNIVYPGAPLPARKAVVWDVRVWDAAGAASDSSAPASWEMGLLTNSDWSAK